jgi:hypothetical protein
LLVGSHSLYLQYQSPDWLAHLHETNSDWLAPPVVVRDGSGRLIGLAPLASKPRELEFRVRDRSFARFRLKTVAVQGSVPLLPDEPSLYDRLFDAVAQSAPDCDAIYLHSVPVDSFCWSHVARSTSIRSRFLVYIPGGTRPFHSIELPATFQQYLSKFKSKKRYNLGRQVRLLREHAVGELRLERIESPEQVPAFMVAATAVVQRSWQGREMFAEIDQAIDRPASLEALARRGLLRSYVLYCGESPCAFVFGSRYRDVYHYAEIGYDQAFAEFSPGTVLLYLIIEDLISHQPVRRMNFGISDADYKREFGTIHTEDASVLLFRKTLANRLRQASHASFTSVHRRLKTRFGGRRAAPEKTSAAWNHASSEPLDTAPGNGRSS